MIEGEDIARFDAAGCAGWDEPVKRTHPLLIGALILFAAGIAAFVRMN